MRKFVSIILAFILMTISAFALAETATSEMLGLWYMTQFISGETAFSCEDTAQLLTCDFKEDGSCDVCLNEDHYKAYWLNNGDGTFTYQEEDSDIPIEMHLEDGYLLMGDEYDYYIFSREAFKPREFAKVVAAEDPAELNGRYVLTYVSGDGFTVGIDQAADILEELGIMDPYVEIDNGFVEFLGQISASFDFDKNDGTLNLTYAYEGFDPQDIKLALLDDGTIAINWVGMTFFAEKVTEE